MWSFGSLWKKYNKNARNWFVIVTFPIPGFVSVVFKNDVRQKRNRDHYAPLPVSIKGAGTFFRFPNNPFPSAEVR